MLGALFSHSLQCAYANSLRPSCNLERASLRLRRMCPVLAGARGAHDGGPSLPAEARDGAGHHHQQQPLVGGPTARRPLQQGVASICNLAHSDQSPCACSAESHLKAESLAVCWQSSLRHVALPFRNNINPTTRTRCARAFAVCACKADQLS